MDAFKINYYLKKIQRDKTYHYILISVIWDKKVVRTTINTPIDIKLWDNKKQRVKLSAPNPKKINEKLDELRFKLEKFYDETRQESKRTPNKKEVKSLIEAVLKDKPVRKKNVGQPVLQKTFFEYFLQFMQDTKDGTRLASNGKRIQDSTYKSYVTTQNHLEEFLKETKTEFNFANIDEKFFGELTKYFNTKELSNNTQGRSFKIIKTFLHYMHQLGLHNNLRFVKALKVFDEDSVIVALTKEELASLENLEEKVKKGETLSVKYEQTRDLFLVQVYTGMRFSDLYNLKKENINFSERHITINMLKTQDNIIIPISSRLEAILRKYDCKLPKVSSQKYNERLKEISKLAKINTKIQITTFTGNKRTDITKPKHEMISSHTARRTFITLTLKKGILPEMVMKISGHKSRKSFQRYVRITQEEAFKQVQMAWEE